MVMIRVDLFMLILLIITILYNVESKAEKEHHLESKCWIGIIKLFNILYIDFSKD